MYSCLVVFVHAMSSTSSTGYMVTISSVHVLYTYCSSTVIMQQQHGAMDRGCTVAEGVQEEHNTYMCCV